MTNVRRIAGILTSQLAVLFLIVGCGGDSKPPAATPTPIPDSVPAAFSFTAVDDQARNSTVTSNSVTITDLEVAAELTITGGQYSIDGSGFASADTTITNNQEVVVQGMSSDAFSTPTTVTLNVGGVAADFVITTVARDDEPEAFAPASPVADVSVSETYTFDAFTVTGINDTVDLTIEQGVGATYRINEGDFTAEAGTVNEGDSVQVQLQAASTFETPAEATLTIGSTEGLFVVLTEAEDTLPEAFDLGDTVNSTTPGEWVESEIITIAGINSAANIQIDNGEFKIVGTDEYPSAATTVTNGQQIQVRVQSSTTLAQTETATLTIGAEEDVTGQSDTFATTTIDNTPPTANVQFPTPNTMSDGTFVTLRGKAQDDFGPVTTINVVVTTDGGATEVDNRILSAGESDNFQTTWSQRVNLAENKVNTITVTATDSSGNVQSTPQILTVMQSTTPINFPVGEDVFIGEYTARGMGWDAATGILYLPNAIGEIISVDTSSGDRQLFVNLSDFYSNPNPASVYILPEERKILVSDRFADAIFVSSLVSLDFEPLTNTNTQNSNATIDNPAEMVLGSDGLLYASDSAEYFYTVNMETGARNLISDDSRPENGENLFDAPRGFYLDLPNNRALVADSNRNELLWVNLSSGARTVFNISVTLTDPYFISSIGDGDNVVVLDSDTPTIDGYGVLYSINLATGTATLLSDDSSPDATNSLDYPTGLIVDQEKGIAFIGANASVFSSTSGVRVVDLMTGERITLTYSLQ